MITPFVSSGTIETLVPMNPVPYELDRKFDAWAFDMNDVDGVTEFTVNSELVREAIDLLDHSGLDYHIENIDLASDGEDVLMLLEIEGKLATHAIGIDADDGSTVWHYETIEQNITIEFPIETTAAKMAQIVADHLRKVVTDTLNDQQESRQIRDTNNHLVHHYNHTR